MTGRDAPYRDLAGTSWRMTMLGSKRASRTTEVTIAFGLDGGLSGSAGCNRYRGSFLASGGSFSASPLGTTRMMCAPAVNEQERLFLAALQAATAWELRRGRLRITSPDSVLVFRSA